MVIQDLCLINMSGHRESHVRNIQHIPLCDHREAHVAGRRYMEQMIARHFTSPHGSTLLYVGRESLLPGISAWPIPHDAPYKHHLDRLMMAVVEVVNNQI